MSDLERSLQEFFAAETDDVTVSPVLPRAVRERSRARRTRKRIAAAVGGLLAVGIVLGYAMPKITDTHPGDAAGLLPSESTAAPTTLPPPAVPVPAELPLIAPEGPAAGSVLAVLDGGLAVVDPATAEITRTVPVQSAGTKDRVVDARWSPDRATVYLTYRSGCVGGVASYGIQQVPGEGGDATPVTAGNDFGFSVSPDGTRLAFARLASGCAAHTVVVRDLRTGVETTRELTAGVVERVDWAGNDQIVIGATVGNGRQRVLVALAAATDSLDLAPALADGALLTATTDGAGQHVIVQQGNRIVDIDPVAKVARGSLGTAAGATSDGFAADPRATRFAAAWVLGDGTTGAAAVWAGGQPAATLPDGSRPVDWSG